MTYCNRSLLPCGERQQRRTETVVRAVAAIVVVRVEQPKPSIGTIARATTSEEPAIAGVDEEGVNAAPRLVVA